VTAVILATALSGVALHAADADPATTAAEIGELKKNHLVLSTGIESLERAVASLRDSFSTSYFERIEDLEREVQALRAEVRRILSA
jgi:hypothetical protein